ncbi:MAG: hypothetical protein AB8H03_27260 [Saprospiraceae bacterium]
MDRFDDIWKNRFNEEDFSESDWNTPDEDVWEGILPHVAPKRDKRAWWMILLGVGIVSILLILTLTKNKSNQISVDETVPFGTLISESAESSNTISEVKETASTPNGDSLVSKSPQIINEALSINVSPKITNNSSSNNTYLKSNIKTVFNSNISTDIDLTEINQVRNEKSTLSNSIKLENVILEDGMKNIIFEENLISIPSLSLFLFAEKSVHPIHVSPEFELVSNKSKALSLGLRTGTTLWKHRISNDYTSDLSPFDFNYQDGWGWQTSFSLNYELSNYFDIFANFQYEQIKTTSGHNSDLTYNVLEEENPSNPLNGYALNLATPYGLSGATFNFNRGQTLASDEVNLLVDFNSEHLIRNLSLPVGIAIYPFGKKQKFIPSVSLGFGVNYLAQISNKIHSIETHHDAIQYDDSGSSTFVSPDLEKWHFDYRLGIGLQYELQRNLHLQFNYDWTRGLNPIYKFENYETRIDRHQISLGLTRSFHP